MTESKLQSTSESQLEKRARIDSAMSRYASGDSSASGEIVKALQPRLLSSLRKLCRSEELARDLTQETFLRIHRARKTFTNGRAAWPWAYAIAFNCFLSHARAWNTKLQQASVDMDRAELRVGAASDIEAQADARHTLRRVEDLLLEMPEARRAIVRMRADELSVAEMAEELGVSEGAAKLRAFRVSKNLREALG